MMSSQILPANTAMGAVTLWVSNLDSLYLDLNRFLNEHLARGSVQDSGKLEVRDPWGNLITLKAK